MDYPNLSKIVSHALRHEPWLYELELDGEGWTPIELLLSSLRKIKPEWHNLHCADLEEMIEPVKLCVDNHRSACYALHQRHNNPSLTMTQARSTYVLPRREHR